MTYRARNLRGGIEPQRQQYEPLIIKNGSYIGDLRSNNETFKIYQSELENEIQFGLYDDKILVTFFNGDFNSYPGISKAYYLKQMLTKENYSGQHLSAKLLMFLKTREKIPVILSDIHSEDTVNNIRKIAKTVPMLNIQWFNIETGEIDKFNVKQDETDTKHIDGIDGKTNWNILIETFKNNENDTSFKHFISESNHWDISHNYDIWINE